MRFIDLHMKDFRATRGLKIGFEPDMTVIVGRNGAGKTSVLDALCILMQFVRAHLDGPRTGNLDLPYSELDVRKNVESFEIDLKFKMEDQVKKTRWQDEVGITAFNDKRQPMLNYSAHLVAPSNTGASKPRFVYFRQDRGFGWSDNIWPLSDDPELLDPEAVQDRSLERHFQAIPDLEAWWDRRDAQEAREVRDTNSGYRDSQLESIRKLIPEINKFSGINFYFSGMKFNSTSFPAGLHLTKDDGTQVHVSSLSSGERSFIILLADLARRLQVFTPDQRLEDIRAIVLIDEIELNLHPAWQSQIVPMLSQIFASCQFIVTTHSPQVLSGVESRQVRIVEVDATDGSSKVTVPLSTRGRTSNYLLEGVLGSSERFPPVDALIGEFNNAIDGGDAEAAAGKLATLEEQIEDDATTLLVLRKRLKRLRGDA